MALSFKEYHPLLIDLFQECKEGNLDNVTKIITDNPRFHFEDAFMVREKYKDPVYTSGRSIAEKNGHQHIVDYLDSLKPPTFTKGVTK